ncbi:hypothetical protein D3C78_1706920 [compost metagenome]
MSKVCDMEKFGKIVYVSSYLNVIGMSVTKENFKKLKEHENVNSCEMAATGRLF